MQIHGEWALAFRMQDNGAMSFSTSTNPSATARAATVHSAAVQPAEPSYQAMFDFWLAAGPDKWFRKDAEFDAVLRETFWHAHFSAARRLCESWLAQPDSALALILLLDQYPRNSFRDTAHMFATDALALHYAKLALERGFDEQVQEPLRIFFYLPLMHSESLTDQERCVALCEPLPGNSLDFAIEHRDIIAQFGRFPHRNLVLVRETTAAEQAFLDAGGFAG